MEFIEKTGKLGKVEMKGYNQSNHKLMDVLHTKTSETTVAVGLTQNKQVIKKGM